MSPSDLRFDGGSSCEHTFWERGPLKVPKYVLPRKLGSDRGIGLSCDGVSSGEYGILGVWGLESSKMLVPKRSRL